MFYGRAMHAPCHSLIRTHGSHESSGDQIGGDGQVRRGSLLDKGTSLCSDTPGFIPEIYTMILIIRHSGVPPK